MGRVLIALASSVFLLSACGSQGNNPNNDAGTDSIIDFAEGGTCSSAVQCSGGSVCNPATSMCTPSLSCTMHNDCGPAAHCDTNHVCQRSTTASPCSGDMNCSGSQHCISGHCGCNGEVYQAQNINPNMLIVLDRSSSMNQASGGSGSPTKWVAAKTAITSLVNTYSDRVRFGLKVYPGTNPACDQPMTGTCNGGYVVVGVPASTAASITTAMNGSSTCNKGTPTAEALAPLASYTPLEDTARPNYVLLITDGEHTSSCGNPTTPVANLLSQTPSIKTYVIGFGSGVNTTELTDLATAGGTARSGTPKYYQANSQSELEAAFNSIVSGVVSCSYSLSTTPPSIAQLFVYFGNNQVARDTSHTMGWDYEATGNKVTFYGTTCDQLKSGSVTDLAIIYGCPIIVR